MRVEGEKVGHPEEVILDQLSRQRKEESCQDKKMREGEGKGGKEGEGKDGESRRGEDIANVQSRLGSHPSHGL